MLHALGHTEVYVIKKKSHIQSKLTASKNFVNLKERKFKVSVV